MKESERVKKGWPILLPVAIFLIPFLSWGPVPWLTALFALIVAGISLTMAVKEDHREASCFSSLPLAAPLGVLFLLSIVHLVNSPVPYSSVLFIAHLATAAAFLLVLKRWSGAGDPAFYALSWAGLLVGWTIFDHLVPGKGVPGGPFFNPNYLATVLLTCLAFFLGELMGTAPGNRRKAAFTAAGLSCTGALLVIGSRSAGIAAFLLWGGLALLSRGRLRWVCVAVLAAVLLLPTAARYRVTGGHAGDPHAFSRIAIWEASLRMGADHPWLGVGPGLFYEYAPPYAFPTDELPVRFGRIVRRPHNEYLRSWAEGGAVGIGAVLLLVVIVLKSIVLSWKRGRPGPALAMCVMLYQALFHDLTEVYALVALGSWWVSQLDPEPVREIKPGGKIWRVAALPAAVTVLLLSVWLGLDAGSRALWARGRDLTVKDPAGAAVVTGRALSLNPLLPGAARDLASIRFSLGRSGGEEALLLAESSMRLARRLNRLDTVPLRLQAALLVERARREPGKALDHLLGAWERLREALDLEPHNVLIMASLSRVYWDLGQRVAALRVIGSALEEEPNYLEAHRIRISYLEAVDPEAVPRAREELDKASARVKGYSPQSDYERIILK